MESIGGAAKNDAEPLKVWKAPLLDEGPTTAVYPNTQLGEIQKPEDCRRAILDETQPLETEFGIATVQPLYDLVWTLNCGAGVFTSHTAAAPCQQPPPYSWAKEYVAVAIIILSRNHHEHLNKDAVMQSVHELGRIISAKAPTQDHNGWYLSIGPCNMIFTNEMSLTTFGSFLPGDMNGYGVQLIIGGAASNRRNAAARWTNAVKFVNQAIKRTQEGPNLVPARPHRHTIPHTRAVP